MIEAMVAVPVKGETMREVNDARYAFEMLPRHVDHMLWWAARAVAGARRAEENDFACGLYRGQAAAYYEAAWLCAGCPNWPPFLTWRDALDEASAGISDEVLQ